VFLVGADPSKTRLVASLARPGGNMTGLNIFTIEVQAKRLEILHQLAAPGLAIANLFDPDFPGMDEIRREEELAARDLRRQIQFFKAANASDIDSAFTTIAQLKVGGVLVGPSPLFNSLRKRIIQLAAKNAIPAIYEWRESPADGGLISYGTLLEEAFRQAGIYTARILKGEKPAEMPVVQPTKFELVINLKTAKSLGLAIPDKLLALADEVIE
jgi:ABC-type uncharacterized transport system substrate-binding protein